MTARISSVQIFWWSLHILHTCVGSCSHVRLSSGSKVYVHASVNGYLSLWVSLILILTL